MTPRSPIKTKQVYDALTCKKINEEEEGETGTINETLWDLSEQSARSKKKTKKNKKKKKKHSSRHHDLKDEKKWQSPDKSKLKPKTSSASYPKVTKPLSKVILIEEPTKPKTSSASYPEATKPSSKVILDEEPKPDFVDANPEMETSKVVPIEEPMPFVPDVNPETESRSQEHLCDAKAAQKCLNALRRLTNTRNQVELWNEKRYCHRMFPHRTQVNYPQQTYI